VREYQVQSRDSGGRWRRVNMNAFHKDLPSAIKRVTLCDEDGMFSLNFRIIGDGFMYTAIDHRNATKRSTGNDEA
jgi:hypothetical protein